MQDIKPVAALLRRYLERFDIAQTFASDEEVEHWFLSGRGKEGKEGGGEGKRQGQVVWAYVVEVSPASWRKVCTMWLGFCDIATMDRRHVGWDDLLLVTDKSLTAMIADQQGSHNTYHNRPNIVLLPTFLHNRSRNIRRPQRSIHVLLCVRYRLPA